MMARRSVLACLPGKRNRFDVLAAEHIDRPTEPASTMHLYSRLSLAIGLLSLACATDRDTEDRPPALAQPARAALRQGAVGCWALFDDRGRPAEGHIYWAPTFVALDADDDAAQRSPDRPAVRLGAAWNRLPLELEPGIPGWVKWRADSLTDSIRITFSNGFSGSNFVLALGQEDPVPDTIYGYAREYYDAGPPWTKAVGSAMAVRVPCQFRETRATGG